MRCPYCSSNNTRVIDKRESPDIEGNRRRRECSDCKQRFTTYERIEANIIQIKKRDGRIVQFDEDKITNAIFNAAKSVGGTDRRLAENLKEQVIDILKKTYKTTIPTVEEIQDIVEKVLIENGHAKTAKAYILYREKHRAIREAKDTFIDVSNTIGEYLKQTDWRVRENSNEAYSFSGLLLHVSGKMIANYALNHIYPPQIAEAFKKGYIHIHDLSHGFIGYCSGWSLKNLLLLGFGGVPNKVDAKPAKHLNTLIHQMVNYIGCLQMEFAGAQAFNSVDTYLAPFVKADNLGYKEVKQCMQQLIYSLNIPSRWGSQYPFSNLTFDWVIPKDMAKEKAIVGGEEKDFKYGDCQKEADMINRAFLEVMLGGDANGRVFTFPIPTYNLTKDFKWDSENAKLLFEMTAKYGLPYFQNYIGSNLDPRSIRAMCLHPDEEIIIRINGNIEKTTIGGLCEKFGGEFGEDGWSQNKYRIEAMALNKETLKLEWSPIKHFLRVKGNTITIITTKDGKMIRVSSDHLVPVITNRGIKIKRAIELTTEDYMLTTRKAISLLNDQYQRVGAYILDKKLAKFIGLFVSEGSFLYDSRKKYKNYDSLKGIQFSFNAKEEEDFNELISIVKEKFNYSLKIKKDPRFDTITLYLYNKRLVQELYMDGLRKYGQLLSQLFNSPKEIIEVFLDYLFKGDGYKRGRELHINDEPLSRDIVLLYTLINKPVTYRLRNNSQVIRIQHNYGRDSKNKVDRAILYNRVPNFSINISEVHGSRRGQFLEKYMTVGSGSLEKFGGHSQETVKILGGDAAVIQVENIDNQLLSHEQTFYDIELEGQHLFVHSLGTITHNCCRLNINLKELTQRPGHIFAAGDNTGSLGVVTINLNRLGYEASTKEGFFEKLKHYMRLAKDSLEIKREIVTKNMEQGLMPYTKRYLGTFRNHFSTIGVCGMNECCLNLLGKDIASKEGKQLTIDTLKFMREQLVEFQKETGNLYNLEATPAESTSYRLAKLDKQLHPDIITAGEKEPFLTNSTHLPVDYTDDAVSAIEHQNDIQHLYTGGTIFHTFLGEKMTDGEACKQLVKKIAQNTRIPYFTITPTFSVCPEHGYIVGEHFECPQEVTKTIKEVEA